MDTLVTPDAAQIAWAGEANEWWQHAVAKCAVVQADRRKKYSGTDDPYFNFMDMARDMEMPIATVFRFYMAIKWSRLKKTTKDFADERFIDTLIDIVNYGLLWIGWLIRMEEDNGPHPAV